MNEMEIMRTSDFNQKISWLVLPLECEHLYIDIQIQMY